MSPYSYRGWTSCGGNSTHPLAPARRRRWRVCGCRARDLLDSQHAEHIGGAADALAHARHDHDEVTLGAQAR